MKIECVGWCNEDGHDKVWGVIMLEDGGGRFSDNKYVSFWGRRGKKLQTKMFSDTGYGMSRMFDKKLNKGYEQVDTDRLSEVYPEFQDDLEATGVWALLKA